MDKANFSFAYNGKRYVMENMVLTIHDGETGFSSVSDPEYDEYKLAVRVAELEEENELLKEEVKDLRKDLNYEIHKPKDD